MLDSEPGPAITKQTKVREALEGVGIEPCSVSQEEDIREMVERLCLRPGVRTVAVVGEKGRLVGIIPVHSLLLDELFMMVAPEEFLVDMTDEKKVEEFGRMSRAKTAGELMREPVWGTMDDTVRDAFVKLHEHELGGLPIVDDGQRVVGYLDSVQLIRLWLQRQRPPAR